MLGAALRRSAARVSSPSQSALSLLLQLVGDEKQRDEEKQTEMISNCTQESRGTEVRYNDLVLLPSMAFLAVRQE